MEFKNKHISIKNLAEDDRPREKLVTKGKNSLSDAELLAIVLGSGNIKETAIQLAQRILSENDNNLANLAKLNINELKKYRGVGTVKAINIITAFEIGRRRKDLEPQEKKSIKNTTVEFGFEQISDFISTECIQDLLKTGFKSLLK